MSEKSLKHLHIRKNALIWNLIRVKGLLKIASSFFQKEETPDFIRNLTCLNVDELIDLIEDFARNSFKSTINGFLLSIVADVDDYADSINR